MFLIRTLPLALTAALLHGCGSGSGDSRPTVAGSQTDEPSPVTEALPGQSSDERPSAGEQTVGETSPAEVPAVELPPGEQLPVEQLPGEQLPVEPAPELPPVSILDDRDEPVGFDPASDTARYEVTLENLWGSDEFPQDFPDEAHLSLVAGALHDADTVFWQFGGTVSRGMEDIAEAGLIDIFLFDEVVPAIEAGQASSFVEYRVYTDPMVAGEAGVSTFDIEARNGWPRLTLATMLGPSPDWFVGVSSLPLDDEAGWLTSVTVDLPLLDGGSKSDIVPVMGGPDIIPPEPIAYVAYDSATGTYLPSDVPQIVGRLTLTRVR